MSELKKNTSLKMILFKAGELEETLSRFYSSLKEISPLQALKDSLEELAGDETDHARLLKVGLNYVSNAPDAFGEIRLEVDKIEQGIFEANGLIERIKNRNIGLHDALQHMLDLENRFVDIHLHLVVEINDESLKKLFLTLSKGDRGHAARIETLMRDWGIKG